MRNEDGTEPLASELTFDLFNWPSKPLPPGDHPKPETVRHHDTHGDWCIIERLTGHRIGL